MSLDQLFVEGPQFSETTLLKMPPDTEKWPEAILSQVKEQFPVIDSLALTVKFTSIEEQAGTAIGAVTAVHPHLKKAAYIPVIIKDGMMYPLDVWQDDKQIVRPIGPDTFETYFFDERTFQALDKRPASHLGQYFDDPSMWTSTYPPLQGRYAYASVEGALLGEMLEKAKPEELKEFEKSAHDYGVLAGYKRTGLLPLIEKVAAKAAKVVVSAQPSMTVKDPSYVDEIIPLDVTIAVMRKDPKGYSLLTATDEHFVRAARGLSHEKCHSWIDGMIKGGKMTGHADDYMNDVIKNGEKVIVAKIKPISNVFIQDDFKNEAVSANKFGVYRIRRMKDGAIEKGLVIPTVVDFDQNVKAGQKVFLGGTTSVVQDRIAGIPSPTEADLKSICKDLKAGSIQVGQLGTFIIFDGESALATTPVQIVRQNSTYSAEYRVADLNGNVFTVRQQGSSEPHAVQRITKFKGSNGALDSYCIPHHMIWVPMANFEAVSSSPGQFMEKTASLQARDSEPLRLVWTGLNFELTGRGIDKIASGFDAYNMSESDVQFVGLALGADPFTVKRMVKLAKTNGRTVVHGLAIAKSWAPLLEKAAQIKLDLVNYCRNLRTNLVKEAAVLGDQSTVDTVLSLNFLNKDTVQKFVEALPILVKANQKLAELVLASRLGATSIPHDAAVVCMNRMTAVINGLMALDQHLSPLSQKAQDKSRAKAQEATKELGGI